MLVVVVSVFLLVEVPMAVFLSFHVIQMTLELGYQKLPFYRSIEIILNFAILLSYPINFFLYCFMSKQFRDQVAQIFRMDKSAP